MKDEYKLLIGAIIVILIVVVGAFALGGPNNAGPAAAPTVMPATPTPAAVPAEPAPAPSATPVATPTVAPITEAASGVKQTEFGYWITYPPLGPETWSEPKPVSNVVYFDPVSSYVTINAGTSYQGVAHLHRRGNLSGATNVTIHVSSGEFTAAGVMGTYELSNVEYLAGGDVRATFNPDVSDVDIGITVSQGSYDPYQAAQALTSGSLKLTITDADDGYSIATKKEFTFNVGELTTVHFYRDWCYLDTSGGSLSWGPPQYVYDVQENDTTVTVYIAVIRDGDTSDVLTAHATLDTNLPGGTVHGGDVTFNAGDNLGIMKVDIDKTYVYDGSSYYAEFYLDSSDRYVIGDVSGYYRININNVL